jgi:hypothetical protein
MKIMNVNPKHFIARGNSAIVYQNKLVIPDNKYLDHSSIHQLTTDRLDTLSFYQSFKLSPVVLP